MRKASIIVLSDPCMRLIFGQMEGIICESHAAQSQSIGFKCIGANVPQLNKIIFIDVKKKQL